MQSDCELVFTLVHGTFAKGARWVSGADSKFRSNLETELKGRKVAFDDSFSWGSNRLSDNTERARQLGAGCLRRHLRRQTKNNGAKHFLIAHSHGGNVALYALRKDPLIRESIDGLVCMATPFLFPRARKLPIGLLLISFVFLFIMLQESFEWRPFFRWAFIAVAAPYVAGACWVILRQVGQIFRSREPWSGVVPQRMRGLSLGDEAPAPLLIIRPSGDEASGLLRSGQFANWILGTIWRRLTRLFYSLFILGFIVHWGVKGLRKTGFERFQPLVDGYQKIDLDPLFGWLLGAACLVSILMLVARLLFSFDGVSWMAEIEPLVEDAPPGMKSQILVLPPQEPDQGDRASPDPAGKKKTRWALKLDHTEIYERPEVAREIARWVTEIAAAEDSSATDD